MARLRVTERRALKRIPSNELQFLFGTMNRRERADIEMRASAIKHALITILYEAVCGDKEMAWLIGEQREKGFVS